MSIAQAFNLAFEDWLLSKERRRREEEHIVRARGEKERETKERNVYKGLSARKQVEAPADSYKYRYGSAVSKSPVVMQGNLVAEDKDLLIDLSSLNFEKQEKLCDGISRVEDNRDSHNMNAFGEEVNEEMDLSFTQYVLI